MQRTTRILAPAGLALLAVATFFTVRGLARPAPAASPSGPRLTVTASTISGLVAAPVFQANEARARWGSRLRPTELVVDGTGTLHVAAQGELFLPLRHGVASTRFVFELAILPKDGEEPIFRQLYGHQVGEAARGALHSPTFTETVPLLRGHYRVKVQMLEVLPQGGLSALDDPDIAKARSLGGFVRAVEVF